MKRVTVAFLFMTAALFLAACGEKADEPGQDAFVQDGTLEENEPESDNEETAAQEETPAEIKTEEMDVIPRSQGKNRDEMRNFAKGYYEVGQDNMGYLFLQDTMLVQESEDAYYHFHDNKKSVEFAYFDYSLSEAYSRYVAGLMNNSQAYYEVGNTENDYRILMVNNPLNDGVYDIGYAFLVKNPRDVESTIGITVSVKKDSKDMQEMAGDILASWHNEQMFNLEVPMNQSAFGTSQANGKGKEENETEADEGNEATDDDKEDEKSDKT